MPIFYTYDMSNISANKSIVLQGSFSDAFILLKKGKAVYRQHKSWTKIEWGGIFTPKFIPNPTLTISAELAMYLDIFKQQSVYQPFSREAIKTFEKLCKTKYGTTIKVSNIPENLGQWATAPIQHKEALVDKTDKVQLNNWALQKPSIASNGTFIPGADPKTVVYNKSDQGSFWLARWTYNDKHYFTVLTEPYFSDVTHLIIKDKDVTRAPVVDVNTFGDITNVDSESVDTDDSEDETETSGQYQDNPDDIVSDDDSVVCDVDYNPDYDPDPAEDAQDGLEYELYTKEEQTMLPLGYMIPRATEWKYVMEAIMSNFIQVKNLLNVRDYTLMDFYIILGIYGIPKKYARGATYLVEYIKKRRNAMQNIVELMEKLEI
uniref:DNA repair exonuclease SbcCD D subunit n=1 Tax=Rhinella marina erythrocytic-like virus TaxID=2859906 RepID=A0A8F6YJU2_9VIRU|nr:DNA repair exonuclease SbcCD D subunit [Rhinella marina erythrocytic-like virus]